MHAIWCLFFSCFACRFLLCNCWPHISPPASVLSPPLIKCRHRSRGHRHTGDRREEAAAREGAVAPRSRPRKLPRRGTVPRVDRIDTIKTNVIFLRVFTLLKPRVCAITCSFWMSFFVCLSLVSGFDQGFSIVFSQTSPHRIFTNSYNATPPHVHVFTLCPPRPATSTHPRPGLEVEGGARQLHLPAAAASRRVGRLVARGLHDGRQAVRGRHRGLLPPV